MRKITGLRIGAYFIDMIVVSIIVSLFTSITYLNPNAGQAKEYEEMLEAKTKEILKENPVDLETFYDDVIEYSYKIDYSQVYASVIELVILFLYFGLFQFFNNGQTIGKRLLNIQVVSENKEKLRFSQTIIRSAFLNSILLLSLSIIAVLYLTKRPYATASFIIDVLDFTIVVCCAIMMLRSKDNRGLHDRLAGTRVIASDELELFLKSKEVKEANVSEKRTKRRKNENRDS